MLQVELHPFLPQEELHKLASDNGIVVTAYSPLGAGHGKWERAEEAKDLLKDKKLEGIGEKYGKTPSQVILRWIVSFKFSSIITLPQKWKLFIYSDPEGNRGGAQVLQPRSDSGQPGRVRL